MILASHWTTGGQTPPILIVLAVVPTVIVAGVIVWILRRGWRDPLDPDAGDEG